MNWGKWIIVSFVLFAGFIATLVTVCMRQEVNLVSKDYYKDELAYQEQITRISNTRALVNKPSVSKTGADQLAIVFQFPIDKGELRLFCPSDPAMDRSFEIDLNSQKQLIDVNALKRGMYRAKLYWSANAKEYYMEEIIYL